MRSQLDFKPLLELLGLMIGGMLLSALGIQFLGLEITTATAQTAPYSFLAAVALSLIFSFGLPALLWLKWRGNLVSASEPKSKNISLYIKALVLFVALMLVADYFMAWFTAFLELRGWSELTAEPFNMTAVRDLLTHKNILPYTIVAVSIIPAVVEELFFRRVIFTYLYKSSKSFWTPAILSSLFFSGMHNHFLSFVPIFLLGLALAFAYYATKNIWTPILLHAANNAFSIFVLHEDLDGEVSTHWILALIAAMSAVYLLQSGTAQNAEKSV